MENVWTNFKTDEETFKLIMKYEENFVKTIVQKKYGINYDNKDEVKLTKKENEIFALASLLIEIDVLCIKNLKDKHINVDSFFKKEEGLMQRKICTAYDLQIDKLENIIIRLPEDQRKIFIYSYGINRRKMSFKDIEKLFEVSTDDIYKNLLLTIRRLKSEVNIMKSVKKVTNKIPTMLMLDLEKRGYPRSELIEALNLYDDKTKYTLQKYYGFNYSSAKSPLIPVAEGDEAIINSVLIGDNNIDFQIKKLQEKKLQAIEKNKRNNRLKKEKTFNLIKFYKDKGYSALEFLNAYRSLSERQCALIKKKYDNEFNEIKDAKLSYKEKAMIFDLTRSERSGIGKILAETTNKTMPKIIKTAEQPQEVEKEILEKKNEEVIQPIKVKKTPAKSKDITLPQKSNTFDSVEKKDVNSSTSKDLTENKPNNEKGIKNFDTFNEYCKSLGFDDEDLENMYNELSAKEKERFNKCIIVTEDAEKKHTFTFTKRITQNHDQLNYQYYTQSVIIRLYRGRLRNNKSVDNIEVSKNVKNHLRTNSIRGNNTPKIENYIHLNGYYKALGFDDEDMENLYLSLNENPTRHDRFYRLFNIIEEEKHMFIFTKPAADLCQKDHDYLTKDIPISLCKCRIKKGKGVDNIKLPPSIKKSGERVKTTPTISIKKYKTLNGFIKAIGFDDEDLEEVYKNLTKREKDIFSETINVSETEDKKHIFTFVRRIDTNDKRNYKYYNKTILVKLYRCRVKNNKSIENLNLTENIKRYIDFHSPKTSRMEIINDYKTLNDYYKSLGFDDEDMEDLYLSLASIPFRHDYFYKTMNIVEEAENKHIFTFKKSIANLNKKDFHYLMQDIPESICIHRIRSGKGVDGLKLNNTITNFVKKEIEKENSKSNKGKLDYCKNLNDYYKKYGITDEELTNAYKSANQGKKYFEEFTTITKVNEEKYIFEIKSTLKYRHDLPAYVYFTSNLLIYLKHKKKQTKQEIQNNLVIAEGPSFDNIKEYIHEYLSEIKSSHIITKDLILNLNLPKRYEYFLLNEFVINKDGSMSLDEEAKHFNMDSMELCKILVDAIKLVKENVISKMNHFTDTATLAEKNENKKTLS